MANRSSLPDPHRERILDSSFARAPFTPRARVLDRSRRSSNDVSQALAELSIVRNSLAQQPFRKVGKRFRPAVLIGLADFAGLALSWIGALLLTSHFSIQVLRPGSFGGFMVALAAFFSIYLVCGIYPGITTHPVDELRRLSIATTLSSFVLFGFSVLKHSYDMPRILAVLWATALITVPVSRTLVRKACCACHWWGIPTLILGAGQTARKVASILDENPQLGLKPVGILDNRANRYERNGWNGRIPYLGPLSRTPAAAQRYQAEYAIVAMPRKRPAALARTISRYAPFFPHILIVPSLQGAASLWVRTRNVGPVLGLEISQLLAHRAPQFVKRGFDVALSAAGILILAPVFLAVYLLIRQESRGRAFYFQTRIGRDGKPFRLWKFRSMYENPSEVLLRALANDESLAAEWKENHKLRKDPRVTPIGRILRKLSLDELPQLWNVLIGDMSLVGPRPIVSAEISRYGLRFASYALVRPGITGLWQVSGRNNTSYAERIRLDEFYVRNWSVWFDIYVLARTLKTVLTCEGAY